MTFSFMLSLQFLAPNSSVQKKEQQCFILFLFIIRQPGYGGRICVVPQYETTA